MTASPRRTDRARLRTVLIVALAACSMLALAMPAAAAPPSTSVSPDPTDSNVSAYGGAVVWSRRAGKHDYRLVLRQGGVVRDAGVRPFRHPVDADLAPGRHGGIVAEYSRCKSSRRCDVFSFHLGSPHERKLRSLAGGRPEIAPSSWKGLSVFGRVAKTTGPAGEPFLFAKQYRKGGLFKTSRHSRLGKRSPFASDLRGHRVAYASETDPVTIRTQLFHSRPGRDCSVFALELDTSSGEEESSPVIYGDYIYWLRNTSISLESTEASAVARRRVPSPRCGKRGPLQESEIDRVPKGNARPDSIAIDRGHLYFSGPRGVRQIDLSRIAFSDG